MARFRRDVSPLRSSFLAVSLGIVIMCVILSGVIAEESAVTPHEAATSNNATDAFVADTNATVHAPSPPVPVPVSTNSTIVEAVKPAEEVKPVVEAVETHDNATLTQPQEQAGQEPPAPEETDPQEPYGPINDDEFQNVAIAAFQPSHFLTFRLQRRSEEVFQVESDEESKSFGQRVQGNFFITNGGDLCVDFKITAPNGDVIFERTHVSEGYYDFNLSELGVYTVTFSNPQSDDSRKITFAWLLGEDMDKPKDAPIGEKADEATATLFHSVSRIHRKLDKVISGMAFMDVRLSRNQEIQRNTSSRVALFSVIESCVLAGVTLLQAWYIRRIVDNSNNALPGATSKTGRRYR